MLTSEQYKDFLSKAAEVLEIEESELESNPFKDVESFDSMGKISIGLLIEEEFGWQIPFETLDGMESFQKLWAVMLENT